MVIRLERSDVDRAFEVAEQRMAIIRSNALEHRYYAPNDTQTELEKHVMGAMGEIAFCSKLGIEFPAKVNTFSKEPDVDPFIQVRTTAKRSARLWIRPSDRDREVFVLVHDRRPTFELLGWAVAGEAKKAEPHVDPRGVKTWFPKTLNTMDAGWPLWRVCQKWPTLNGRYGGLWRCYNDEVVSKAVMSAGWLEA